MSEEITLLGGDGVGRDYHGGGIDSLAPSIVEI